MSNFGPQGFGRTPEQVIDFATKRGLCPNCSQQTHQSVGNILTRKMVPLEEVKDKNGAVVVYKGYCVQPTCNTLNAVKKLLGETIPRERRRRKSTQDPTSDQMNDVVPRQRGDLARAHLSQDTTTGETGRILPDYDSSSHRNTGFRSTNLYSSSDLESGNVISPDSSSSSRLHASGVIPDPNLSSELFPSAIHQVERDDKSKSSSEVGASERRSSAGDFSHSNSLESIFASRSTTSTNESQPSQEEKHAATPQVNSLTEMREAASIGDFTLLLILLEKESNQLNKRAVVEAFVLLCRYVPGKHGKSYVFASDVWMKSLKVVIDDNAGDEEIQNIAVATLAVLSAAKSDYMFDIVKYGGAKLVLSVLNRYRQNPHIVDNCCCAMFCITDRNFRAGDPMPNGTGLLLCHEMGSRTVDYLISVIETSSMSTKSWIFCALFNLSLQNLPSQDGKTFGQVVRDAAHGQGIRILISALESDAEHACTVLLGLQLLTSLARCPENEEFILDASDALMPMIITVINSIEDFVVQEAGFNLLGNLAWDLSCLSPSSMTSLSETISTSMASYLANEQLQTIAMKSVSNLLRPSYDHYQAIQWDHLVQAIIRAMHEHMPILELQCSGCLALATIASGSDACKLAVLENGGVREGARALRVHLSPTQHTDMKADLLLFACTMFASLVASPLIQTNLRMDGDIATFMKAAKSGEGKLPEAVRLSVLSAPSLCAKTNEGGECDAIDHTIDMLMKVASVEDAETALLNVRNLCQRSSGVLTSFISANGGTGIAQVTALMSRYTVSQAVQESACDILAELFFIFPLQGQIGLARQVEVGSASFSVVTHSEAEVASIRKAIKSHKAKASLAVKAFNALTRFFSTASDCDFEPNEKLRECFSGMFKDCVDALSVHGSNLEVFNSTMVFVRCLLLLNDEVELRRWGSYLVNAILSNVEPHRENDDTCFNVSCTIRAIIVNEQDDSAIALLDKRLFATSFLQFLATEEEEVIEVSIDLVAIVASRVVWLIEHFLDSPDFARLIVNCMTRFASSTPIVESCCSVVLSISTVHDDRLIWEIVHRRGPQAILDAIENHKVDESVQEIAWKAFASLVRVIPNRTLEEIKSILAEATLRSIQCNMMHAETEVAILEVFLYLCAKDDWFKDFFTKTRAVTNVIEVMDLYLHDRSLQGAGCRCLWIVGVHGDNKVAIADSGGLSSIINAMLAHLNAAGLQKDCLATLKNLATTTRNKEILRSYGGDDAIVISMRGNLESEQVVAAALAALNNVAVDATTRVVTDAPVGAIDCILIGMKTHIISREVQTNGCFLLKSYSFSRASVDVMRSRNESIVERLSIAAEAFPETCAERAYYLIDKLLSY